MDFRINWLAHFKHEVDEEIKAAHGNAVAGRAALAQKIEKSPDTVYQHYAQKSNKEFPTVEMMVMLEKKYARGRPVGWSSQPLESGVTVDTALVRPALSLVDALDHLVRALNELPDEDREPVAQQLLTLARAPDSQKALAATRDLLSPAARPPSPEIVAAAEKVQSPVVKLGLMKGGRGKTTVGALQTSQVKGMGNKGERP